MTRAAVLILAVLTVCLYAAADPGPATDASQQAQDFVRFGRQDMANGLATTALYYFNEALALQPNSPDAWAGKARALDRLKRYDEARAASEKAISFAPGNPALWGWQGKILFDQKRFGEALTALDKATALGNTDTTVWRWKGQTLDSLGRHDEALNAYSKATPPYQPYRGGITRLTSGGPRYQEERPKSKRPTLDQNSTETAEPAEGHEGEGAQGRPQSGMVPYDEPYGDEEGQAPPAMAENPYVQQVYYVDGFFDSGDGKPHHRHRKAYDNYYHSGSARGSAVHPRGGGPRSSAPRLVAPYRGVEPLYQQGAVPRYFQGVTPPTDFRASPDYHAAAGDPIIGDRNYGTNRGMYPGNGYYPKYDRRYPHRGYRGGHGGH